jgi:F-type H+-transporting ATPase subunit b
VAQARLTAENEGRSILSQVRSTMADEIVDAAEKLLREKLGPAEHEKLITNSLNKVVLH